MDSLPLNCPEERHRGSNWAAETEQEEHRKDGIYPGRTYDGGFTLLMWHKLTEILRRLACDGNTVIVIEHNLDVIKTADYIIDIGPEGGDKGGTVIACGTPEEVAENEKSYTGKYIGAILKKK